MEIRTRAFRLGLILAMAVSIIALMSVTASAADKVTVNTLTELNEALSASGSADITIGTEITETTTAGGTAVCQVNGNKTINLNNHTVTLTYNGSPADQIAFNIGNGASLEISGNGKLVVDGYITRNSRTMFNVGNGGYLKISGCTLDIGREKYTAGSGLIADKVENIFGIAINVEKGGKADIYGGSIYGYGGTAGTITCADDPSAILNIYGGTVYGKNRHDVLSVGKATVKIYAGTLKVIDGASYSKLGVTTDMLDSTASSWSFNNTTLDKSTALSVELLPLAIQTSALKTATANKAYSDSLKIKNGVKPFKWEMVKNDAYGLKLSSSGELTGTIKNAAGKYSLTVKITDALGRTQTKEYTLTVVNENSDITSSETITLKAGEKISSLYLDIDDHNTELADVVLTSGTLPDGVAYKISPDGVSLYGTPSKAGTYSLQFKATRSDDYTFDYHSVLIKVVETEDPAPVEPDPADDYVFPFVDVPESQWYYQWVKGANQMGLINGVDATHYKPDNNMTYAEAIKLAACMNQKYNTGSVTLTNGTVNWYDTYVDYCMENGIISQNYASVINKNIDRQTYAAIFAKCLPSKALKAKNTIPDESIYDVNKTNENYNAIYTLYRAGIVNGNDSYGAFNPYSSIKRSEVAAILNRMMDESVRVGAPPLLGKYKS